MTDALLPLPAEPRHDGWTTVTQVAFLETLAATGIVTEACHVAQMSSSAAYAFRRRSPLFAAAWEEALGLAREKLADTLLARSLEGQTITYLRDGEQVGEKKLFDSRLGLAILGRLDRRAQEREAAGNRTGHAQGASFDAAINAIIARDPARADGENPPLPPRKVPEVDKVDTVRNSSDSAC
ncbi:hypothetical protein [Sphingomicrobium aestuariivivum]|uniref:hypothetical protein n=1 Tax=Sphingomicrobium aestuariivivum TaxID=1582356 RepID=UPI001FD69E00|nr:hypothetical protein [Sphingomicrobium aestuariivivum]MCJ8190238.1 hypothetical protein [Sphingomicrobium aestuariivivum]